MALALTLRVPQLDLEALDFGALRGHVGGLRAGLDLRQPTAGHRDAGCSLLHGGLELILRVELGEHLAGSDLVALRNPQLADDRRLTAQPAGRHTNDAVARF